MAGLARGCHGVEKNDNIYNVLSGVVGKRLVSKPLSSSGVGRALNPNAWSPLGETAKIGQHRYTLQIDAIASSTIFTQDHAIVQPDT